MGDRDDEFGIPEDITPRAGVSPVEFNKWARLEGSLPDIVKDSLIYVWSKAP